MKAATRGQGVPRLGDDLLVVKREHRQPDAVGCAPREAFEVSDEQVRAIGGKLVGQPGTDGRKVPEDELMTRHIKPQPLRSL